MNEPKKRRRHGKPAAKSVKPPPPREERDKDASVRLVEAEGLNVPHKRRGPRPRPVHPHAHASVRAPAPAPASAPAPAPAPGPEGERRETLSFADERPSDPDVAARIRELEERLDRMIDAHAQARETATDEPPPPPSSMARPPRAPMSSHPPEPEGMLDTARELLSTDFYLRKWGRLGLRNRSEEVDEFGYDPVYEEKVRPFFDFLYQKYFRVEAHGVERVPAEGRCLLVANHSGTLPVDGMMLRMAVRREHPQHRDVRWLAENVIFHFPFLGSFTNRLGAVRACPENAERLLDHGALVAVFPEGMKGIGKLFKQRYRLQRFGRGGFVKLCLRTRTPVVPVAIVGGEETNPMLARVEYLTKALGIPYFPVTPTFPLLGPVGLLPAPTKWKIQFGQPLDFSGYGPESAEDEILVGRLTEQVRGEIQSMLDRAVGERRSVWFG